MDISNGRLGFTQDLDNQKFLNALRQSNRGVTDFNAHLQQNFNQSLISVNDLAKGVTAFLTIDMARDFVNQMVKIRGEFEQTEIAFNTMLQSREKGNALMKEMVELAKNTPMQFSEVSQGAKHLLAYQVEAEKLTETLSMLGDISSGLGVPMSRLILVYGQVRAKGRLMGDDLRQFTEAGVPMIAMIAKNMGVAQSAVADMVSEGKVGFKEVEKVLEQLTSQGGLFYNMMEEQSKTIPGQIAKLEDEIEQMFNSIGKDSQGFVSDVIGGASTVVENYKEIGNVLGVLITTYGAYKAALITVSALESARAKTVATEIANLSISEKMQLGRLAVTQRQAQATLASAEAELVNNQAILTTMRAEVSSLALKKQKAVAVAKEKADLLQLAQTELSASELKLQASMSEAEALQYTSIQKKVLIEQNKVQELQEKLSLSNKQALVAAETQRKLVNDAKIAQQNVINNQTRLNIALENNESEAIIKKAQAELTASEATYANVQADISSANAKKTKLITIAQERLANVQAAKSNLANAQAELASLTITSTAREVHIAQKNVEKAQNTVLATQEAAEVARKNALGASQTFYNAQQNLGIQAQKNKIAQTAVSNAQDAVSVSTKNLNTAATARLTLTQHAQALSAKVAATWQAFLNATMLANPIVAVTAVVGGLIAAYFLLRDTTTAVEKAQDAYNKTQEEVKSKLDETKQKAEEYINILKDETTTVYQQIEAYKALQLLKLKGFEKLSQDKVQAMDVNELKKLINEANDIKGLDLQKQKLTEIENQIKSTESNLKIYNETLSKGGKISQSTLNESYNKLEVLNKQYDAQLNKVNQIDRDMKFANMTLEQKRAYWENIISTTEKQIFTLSNVNTNQEQGLNLAQQVSNAFQSWDVSRLNYQLNEAQNQLIAINGQINSAVPEIKNKSYWEKQKNDASASRDALGVDKKGTKEWVELTKRIDEANNALQAYNDSYKKPKKAPKPKKEKDPVEVYKKQVSEIEKQYEQYLKILDSNDVTFATEKAILKAQLSSKGASYEEYLRSQQKELIKTAKTSDVARKKLLLINDELLKLSKHSELQIFKDEFEKQLDDLDSVIEKLYEVQNLKESLRGKSDPLSIKKIEFIDEKQKELLKDSENAARSLFKTLTEESKPLDAINKKFDDQLFLLKKKINDANEEINKLTISANSSPEGSNERIKIEEKILKLKKEILDTQNLIDINESKRTVETKNVTNNVDYNKLLSEYQSYEDKIKAIDDKMKADLLTNQTYYETQKKALIEQGKLDEIKALDDIKKAKDAQIEKQATDDTSSILKDQLINSEEWAMLFSNMDELTVTQIDTLIKQIEGKFNQLKGKFNILDAVAVVKQLKQAKKAVEENNPFGQLAKGFADLFTKAEAGTEENTQSIVQKWDRVEKALEASFDFIDDALKSTGVLKDGLGETAKAGLQAISTTVASAFAIKDTVETAKNAITSLEKASVILVIISAALKAAQAIAKFLSNIFSKDKKREKQIKEHKKSVDELTNSYKDLEDAAKRALGSDVYSGQKQMIDNLKQQEIEYRKMIEAEKGKKKKDAGKIKEWEDAIRSSEQARKDLLDEIADDVLQTNAKDLANELGDALAEAFGKGEDAAKSFEKVANDVLKNAILNQLKKEFLENQLKGALDKLKKDMGGDDEGNFSWNQLTPEEQQEFRDKIKNISKDYLEGLEMYSDLFKDLVDPNENSLSGAIKGMSEETGNALLGQFNAIRILQKELVTINVDSNKILLNSLDRLANIDYNTRSVLPLLEKLINRIDNAGRAYGF